MKNKEKFAEKRKFGIPLDTFVEIELSKKDIAKIQGWIKNRDSISIIPSTSNFIVLLNETKLKNRHS
jgi:hypothetical protein